MSSVPSVRRFLELSFNITSIWLLNLIEARKNISAYLGELRELTLKYNDLKSLCKDEIN